MNKQKHSNFISVIKKILPKIKQENFPEWQMEMESDLTHAFIFNTIYTVEDHSVEKTPLYEIVDLELLHDIKKYKTIEDFLGMLTGEDSWNEEYGFETYYTSLKEDWINKLFSEIDNRIANDVEQIDDEQENLEFIELIKDLTEEFWNKWTKKSFKKMIDDHYKDIWEEDKIISMELDMEFQEDEHNFKSFEVLAIDWLANSKEKEINKLKLKDKETLAKLQIWANNKNYEELALFDEFYPKEKRLQNFKWLNKDIYDEKMKQKSEIINSIDALLEQHGASVKTNIISSNIQQLYQLRKDIFSIEGEKIVTIQTDEESNEFYLDEYNRTNGEGQGVVNFITILENTLKNLGSLVVRQITKEMYFKKKGKKMVKTPYLNVYGAILVNGAYKGVDAEDMYQSNSINPETGRVEEDEGIRFLDWKIGNPNI